MPLRGPHSNAKPLSSRSPTVHFPRALRPAGRPKKHIQLGHSASSRVSRMGSCRTRCDARCLRLNECVTTSSVLVMDSESDRPVYWVRTLGGPRPGDPRDGELHQFFGPLRDQFDLEPPVDGADARYVRDTDTPPVEEDGRTIWIYRYQP